MATVTSPEEARQAVNKLIDAGAEVIKTAVESGYTFRRSGWLPVAFSFKEHRFLTNRFS
jgi:hypothetical protein